MDGKNMNNEHGNTMSSTKGEKDLIVKSLVWYYVNIRYKKIVEQFVTCELYNELKMELVAIKVKCFISLCIFV
jgi:hypothetical protein